MFVDFYTDTSKYQWATLHGYVRCPVTYLNSTSTFFSQYRSPCLRLIRRCSTRQTNFERKKNRSGSRSEKSSTSGISCSPLRYQYVREVENKPREDEDIYILCIISIYMYINIYTYIYMCILYIYRYMLQVTALHIHIYTYVCIYVLKGR